MTSHQPELEQPDARVNQPAAGWYPDSENAAKLRYWDGRRWTRKRAIREEAVAPMPAHKSIGRRALTLLGILVLPATIAAAIYVVLVVTTST